MDADLVDQERLRDEWEAPVPHAGTTALLQAAWLAQQPRPAKHARDLWDT